MMPLALVGAAQMAGGFIERYWKVFAVLALLFAVWWHGHARGVAAEKVRTVAAQLETEKVRAQHERLVAEADRQTRAAEAEARRIEKGWRDWVSLREKEHAAEKDTLRTERDAARASKRVLDAAVDAYARAGFTTGDSAAACGDLRGRVETLGLLVKERDDMAGACEEHADAVGSSLRLCRGYVEGLTR